jgi:hypothetical protein
MGFRRRPGWWMACAWALVQVVHAQAPAFPEPARIDCTAAAFPELRIGGDDLSRYPGGKPTGFRGFSDPCVRKDPVRDRLWMAYAWPHMERLRGPLSYAVGVQSHLAYSDDAGRTWTRSGVLWARSPARYADFRTGRPRDGYVSHEMPNLVPFQTGGGWAWAGVRLDYFLGTDGNYTDRENLSFCLRVMAAPTPDTLGEVPYVTFGHDLSSPENRVNLNLSRFSDDFPRAFIPTEPALAFVDGRLFLAFVCLRFEGNVPDFAGSFIAVFSTVPDGDVRVWDWTYHGKLAGNPEARELGGESLTQIELARARDGALLAFVTPEVWDPKAAGTSGGETFGGIRHLGCVALEVESLLKPALARRPNGRLAVRAFLYSSADGEPGPGSAAYDPASETGVLFTLRHIASLRHLSWSIHPTGHHP